MKLPTQTAPVSRTASGTTAQSQIVASGIPCMVCKAGCDLLSGTAKTLCLLACDKTVC